MRFKLLPSASRSLMYLADTENDVT